MRRKKIIGDGPGSRTDELLRINAFDPNHILNPGRVFDFCRERSRPFPTIKYKLFHAVQIKLLLVSFPHLLSGNHRQFWCPIKDFGHDIEF